MASSPRKPPPRRPRAKAPPKAADVLYPGRPAPESPAATAPGAGARHDPPTQSAFGLQVAAEAIEAQGETADASLAPEEDYDRLVARILEMRKAMGNADGQKLAYPKRDRYHRHWFNDSPGRIDEAKMNGWAHVKDPDTGAPVKRPVGLSRDNAPLYAVVMELPMVIWVADMARKHAVARGRIDALKRTPFQSRPGETEASDGPRFYSPTEAITVTNG